MDDAENKPALKVQILKPSMSLITLAVPTFGDLDPEVWFSVLEIEFSNRNIHEDSAKFSQLVPRLPRDMLNLIRHILLSKSEYRYETAKQCILTELRPSDKMRLEELLHRLPLGDKKPSALLREMQQAARTSQFPESLLQELWMQRLPEYTQGLLCALPARPLCDLASSADAIHARFRGTTSIPVMNLVSTQVVSCDVPQATQDCEILSLSKGAHEHSGRRVLDTSTEVALLRRELAELRVAVQRPRSASQTLPTRSRSPPRSVGPSDLCWYHQTYGANAKRCRSPCARRNVNLN